MRTFVSLVLFALASGPLGCGDGGAAPVTPASDVALTPDAGSTPDGASDDGVEPPGDAALEPCTSCAALVGTVSRKPGTKPSAGGKGALYIAVFDGKPIMDADNAKLVARALIEDVDLNDEATRIAYRVEGIPTATTERQIVAFLDDNGTASETNPAPDKGDLVTIEIPAFSGVKVKLETPGDHTRDLQLNAAIP